MKRQIDDKMAWQHPWVDWKIPSWRRIHWHATLSYAGSWSGAQRSYPVMALMMIMIQPNIIILVNILTKFRLPCTEDGLHQKSIFVLGKLLGISPQTLYWIHQVKFSFRFSFYEDNSYQFKHFSFIHFCLTCSFPPLKQRKWYFSIARHKDWIHY